MLFDSPFPRLALFSKLLKIASRDEAFSRAHSQKRTVTFTVYSSSLRHGRTNPITLHNPFYFSGHQKHCFPTVSRLFSIFPKAAQMAILLGLSVTPSGTLLVPPLSHQPTIFFLNVLLPFLI